VGVPLSSPINVSGIIPDGVTKVGVALEAYNCTHDILGAIVLPASKQLPAVTFRFPGVYRACLALDGVHYVEQTGPSIVVTSGLVSCSALVCVAPCRLQSCCG
jgi:hypothetical protein